MNIRQSDFSIHYTFTADPVINKVVSEQTDDNATLIVCTVGDKPRYV